MEVVIKIGEDWKYEQDCVIRHSHPRFCIAGAEDEHIENGGDVEDDEDAEGHHQGGLGQCQRIRRLAKLARGHILNTETAPEDIEDVSEGETRVGVVVGVGQTRVGGDEDDIVHEALHGHVETVGVSQHLDVHHSLDIFSSSVNYLIQ